MAVKQEQNFEKGLARLEQIVQALDSGEKPLAESLELFEEGIKLARNCSRQLDEAKGKLEILVKSSDGSVTTEPLNL